MTGLRALCRGYLVSWVIKSGSIAEIPLAQVADATDQHSDNLWASGRNLYTAGEMKLSGLRLYAYLVSGRSASKLIFLLATGAALPYVPSKFGSHALLAISSAIRTGPDEANVPCMQRVMGRVESCSMEM